MSAYEATEARRQRGLAIAAVCRITRKDGQWVVPSQKGQGTYRVRLDSPDNATPSCTCKDFEERAQPCKHVFAVQFVVEREANPDGSETVTETLTVSRQTTTPRKTYRQNCPAYNKAQTTEKHCFQVLMADLCKGVAEPPVKPGKGQRPLSLANMVFAVAFKVYSTVSSRRFACDLADAQAKGHIDKAPHFNSVLNYLRLPELTPILRNLIAETSRPLASVEQDFAADSSGFTTCRFETWFDHKYGVVRRQHEWVKVHIMCGVKTNVITAVEIRGKDAQDSPLLPDLLNTTAKRFTMREVSADKAYGSLNNYAEISRHGATPFIPFKSIHTGAGGGLWEKMYHYFNLHREDFLTHYHKRSNVESTFSMVKAKFGDSLRGKTTTAMVNEALCKLLCHNICCLVHAQHELGIVATFWGKEEEAPKEDVIGAPITSDDIEVWAWV